MARGPPPRQSRMIGRRRSADDDDAVDTGPDAVDTDEDEDVDNDSVSSDSSTHREENLEPHDIDMSQFDAVSPKREARVSIATANGGPESQTPLITPESIRALSGCAEQSPNASCAHGSKSTHCHTSNGSSARAPIIVSSDMQHAFPATSEDSVNNHETKRLDRNPSFVPYRGVFFMHDHRMPGRGSAGNHGHGGGRGGASFRSSNAST